MADREKTATAGHVAAGTHWSGRSSDTSDGNSGGKVDELAGQWPLDRLVDYIVQTHHRYVRNALPIIAKELTALQLVLGDAHPEMARIAQTLDEMRRELERHLMKEEQILFPYVRQLAGLAGQVRPDWASPFGTVANPIAMMEREHREAFDALHRIRELTNDFAVPPGGSDGGTDYAACMAALADFEADLRRHVHLENTVLFPRALALEKRTLEG